MSKTLLFGGSGFLGNVFLREYPDMISVGRTSPFEGVKNTHIHISDMSDLSQLDDVEFDKVIFLIGNSNHHLLNSECMKSIDYNVIPLKQALHYMQTRKLKKFVCFTSILLYGNEPKERAVNESDEVYPYQNEYLFSKYLAEQVVEFYKDKVPVINVRLSNIYGDTSLIRPDLVPTLINDVLTKEEPTVWSLKPARDFIFATDAAEAIVKVLDTDFTGHLNLGSGEMYSIADIVKIIEELSGKKIKSLNQDVTGVMKFKTDISLIKSLTNWEPKHSLYDGLKKTYDTMKENILHEK